MKESELESILVREVKKEGGKAYKWVSPGNVGVPDRIIFFPGGEVYFVELKTETGNVSRPQMAQIQRLRDLGQQATAVRGLEGLIAFFRAIGRDQIADRLMEYAERRW